MTSNAWAAVGVIFTAALAFLAAFWWLATHITRLESSVEGIKKVIGRLPCVVPHCPYTRPEGED
jgi:hypothetical protein